MVSSCRAEENCQRKIKERQVFCRELITDVKGADNRMNVTQAGLNERLDNVN